MLDNDLIETGVRRIGAEQEMFLVDQNLRPAPVSVEVLAHANDPRLTTEIAKFNLEANLTPLNLSGLCFSKMEMELDEVLQLGIGRNLRLEFGPGFLFLIELAIPAFPLCQRGYRRSAFMPNSS